MKRKIKMGKGPARRGMIGSVVGVLFGIFWTFMAFGMTRGAGGALLLFPLFGILFIGASAAEGIRCYRCYTGESEESLLEIEDESPRTGDASSAAKGYCPYCGRALESDFRFCPGCGRELPESVRLKEKSAQNR